MDNGPQKEAALSAEDIPQRMISTGWASHRKTGSVRLIPAETRHFFCAERWPGSRHEQTASLYPQMDDAELIDMLTRAFLLPIYGGVWMPQQTIDLA